MTFRLTKSLEFGFVSPSALSHGVRCPPGSAVKNPPAVQETQETWVRSLGWEAPLEKGMATLSSILAWGISRTEEPGGLEFMGLQRVGHD